MTKKTIDEQIIEKHESFFVNSFIKKEQQKRIRMLLKNKKGRVKLRNKLSHSMQFNSKSIQEIPAKEQTTDKILSLLNANNAPTQCYLISEHSSLDSNKMELKEALKKVIGSGFATIISCIPGELAYYEGEDNRFILKSN